MSHLGLRIALLAAMVFVVLVILALHSTRESPMPMPVPARTPQEIDALSKADKLPIGSQVERVISATPPTQPVAPPVAQPSVVESARRPRPEGVGFCERYGLRKVVTEGGKSWRCRH